MQMILTLLGGKAQIPLKDLLCHLAREAAHALEGARKGRDISDVREHVPKVWAGDSPIYYDERERDIDTAYDVFNPLPIQEGDGLKVLMKSRK